MRRGDAGVIQEQPRHLTTSFPHHSLPLNGDLCRPSFPDAAARLFADDSAEGPDGVVGSHVVAPDVTPVGGVASVVGVVGDVAPVACEPRAADVAPAAHARQGAAAPWPDAERVPHEAIEPAAVVVRESLQLADATFPADVLPAHAALRLAAALRGVVELRRGLPPDAHCLLRPVAEPARN